MTDKFKKGLMYVLVALAAAVIVIQGAAAGIKAIKEKKDGESTPATTDNSTQAVLEVDYEL